MSDLGPSAETVRRHDPDRFAATLIATGEARRHLLALLAFNVEISRIALSVREEMIGTIRLAWWRETIDDLFVGKVRNHPVANELASVIKENSELRAPLHALIDARAFDLSPDTMPDDVAFVAYADATVTSLILAGAVILRIAIPADLAEAAGRAHARIGHLRGLWGNLARGRMFLPFAVLAANGATLESLAIRPPAPAARNFLADQIARATNDMAHVQNQWRRACRPALPLFAHLRISRQTLHRLARDPFAIIAPTSPAARSIATLKASLTGRPL